MEGTGTVVGGLASVSVRYSLMTGELRICPFPLATLRRRCIQKAREQTNTSPKSPPTMPPPIALLRFRSTAVETSEESDTAVGCATADEEAEVDVGTGAEGVLVG